MGRADDPALGLVEEAPFDPVHRDLDVAAAIHPRVQLAANVDHERFGWLASGRQQKLAGLAGREITDRADDELAA